MAKGWYFNSLFGKMYWKLVGMSGFTQLFWVKLLVLIFACVNYVTFRKSAHLGK